VGSGAVGLLGRNVLGVADAEYDFAKGLIRLMQPGDGCRRAPLAYWVGEQPYSVIDISWNTGPTPAISAVAYLNGTRIHVTFDTGAATSFLTRRAAARAGFAPDGAGVAPGGFGHGIGSHNYQTWIATFPSFKVGDEEIKNARLRVGDADLPDGDMLLGADFFLSHHIYVANGQDKLYFTYNGGPVFDLRRLPAARDGSPQVDEGPDPVDAAGFDRRGAAYAARKDFEHAIADFTRAGELDPTQGSHVRQRGLARWHNGQPDLALADLDEAVRLKPDDLDALLARARLHLARHEAPAANADLDAASHLAAGTADVRLQIASGYVQVDRLAEALAQFDLWIAAHPDDASLAGAWNGRCWVRAMMGRDLDKALDDCNRAVRMIGNSAEILDSRGLVLLRLGDYDRSIADYDASLRLDPRNAWSLYGRGVDRLRKGMAAEGRSDIDAAIALQPTIAEEAGRHGIAP
jgi:tetratricopeptide (TPR) repeat protein